MSAALRRTTAVLAAAGLAALAGGPGAGAARSALPLPPRPGAWHQVGAATTGKPGKPLRVVGTVVAPGEVAFVVVAPGAKPSKVRWSSYCEFDSDDDEKVEDGGLLSGRGVLAAYPGTFAIAKLCYVSVLVTPPAGVAPSVGFFATPRAA